MRLHFCLVVVAALIAVGGNEAKATEDVVLVNLLEGQRLDIVCRKYYEDSRAYEPLLKYRNATTKTDEQFQLAFGSNRRYDAPPTLKIAVSEDGESYTYYFESVDASNAGEYSCDQIGTKDFFVTVFSRASLRCPNIASPANEFEPLSASCDIKKFGPNAVQWPADFFVMSKGDEVIATEYEDRSGQLAIRSLKGFLHFTRDDHRDAKNLSCLIPSLGLRCGSEAVVVNWKPDSPSYLAVPRFLRKGESRQMSCGVVDLGNPPVELVVEDLSYPESVVEAVQNGTSITFIYNAVNAEMGNASLRCSAGNLTEVVSFVIAEGPESVRPDKEEIMTNDGEMFSISCEAVKSNPASIITYFIDEEKILDPSVIWARPEMDGGAVSCQARNPLTRVESPIAQVPLNVRFLHEKEKEQKSALSFKSGENLSLACPLYGNPNPVVSWTYAPSLEQFVSTTDNDLLGYDDYRVLEINNASEAHAGVYACRATNDVGSKLFTIKLSLLEDDILEDDPSAVDEIPASAAIVIVAFIIIASIIAFVLRRKAMAGMMDVEKGNAQIRASPEPEEAVTLLENNEPVSSPGSLGEDAAPAFVGEDVSFVVTETEPMTEDGDVSRDGNDDPSDSHLPDKHELQSGDERL